MMYVSPILACDEVNLNYYYIKKILMQFPPTRLMVGDNDVLHDDSIRFT